MIVRWFKNYNVRNILLCFYISIAYCFPARVVYVFASKIRYSLVNEVIDSCKYGQRTIGFYVHIMTMSLSLVRRKVIGKYFLSFKLTIERNELIQKLILWKYVIAFILMCIKYHRWNQHEVFITLNIVSPITKIYVLCASVKQLNMSCVQSHKINKSKICLVWIKMFFKPTFKVKYLK